MSKMKGHPNYNKGGYKIKNTSNMKGKVTPQQGFQKEHPTFKGCEKGQFKKGHKMRVGLKNSNEAKINMGLAQKKRFENPKERKKTSEATKKGMKNPLIRKKISEAHKGEKSSFWQGGISFEPYSVDWTKALKRSMRERDRYICQVCGKEPAFDVHHKDYDKKNCNPRNLITLCKSCHSKTNYNRKYWIEYFCYKK